jgi:hypothetical protein
MRAVRKLAVLTALTLGVLFCIAGTASITDQSHSLRAVFLSGSGVLDLTGSTPCEPACTGPMLTFVEHGLPTGTAWSIAINGSTFPTAAETDVIKLLNGTYSYEVGNVSGFLVSPASGVVTLGGAAVEVTINFTSTASPASPAPLVLGLPPAAAYVVVGAVIGVVAIGLALIAWRSGRRKNSPAQHDGRPPGAKKVSRA